MALRPIFLIAQYDSNLIGHIDLVDGTYNAVEHNHSSCIDSFLQKNDELYVAFEDYGARIAKYLGDGKFAPENEDIGTPAPNASAPTGAMLLEQRFLVGRAAFVRLTSVDNYGDVQGYQIVDGQDNVVYDQPTNYWDTITPVYPVFEAAPGVEISGNGPGWYMNDSWVGAERVYIPRGGVAFDGNKMLQILAGPDGNLYMVKSTLGADRTCSDITATLIGSAATYPISQTYFALFSNGEFLLTSAADGTVAYKWDGVTAPVELTGMPYNISERVQEAIAAGKTALYEFANELSMYQRAAETQTLSRIQIPSMVKEDLVMPVIAEIPAGLSDVYNRTFGLHNGVRLTHIRGFKDSNGVETAVGAMLVEDYNTGTYMWFGNVTAQMQTGRLCPLGELDDDDYLILNLQPYKVTGVIEKDGAPAGVDLILVDNDSMNIVGRTKSDPVTGQYSFRCYTNHKKSVFARHPISKGLRLASEVQPTPVEEPDPDPSDWADSGETWGDPQVPWN